MREKAQREPTTLTCVTDLADPFVNTVTRAGDARACTADKGEPVTSVTHAESVDAARAKVAEIILALLDLGQRTGWAVRSRDGANASGTHEFRPGRFGGGGMIWLRAVRRLGFAPDNDNEADALALLNWAITQGIGGAR